MENFLSLKLEKTLMDSIAVINFKTPTPIQAKAIPVALEGKDILGTAQTGTGKTAAFGIPLVNFLLKTKKDTALVMTPTRELATQVMQTMSSLVGKGNIRTALLIGGDSMQKQLRQMKRNPRLIVGTPGRINDHLERRTLDLRNTSFLVLDESDRMLDMGFTPQINQVLRTVPKKHQTLLFSATLPNNIIRLAEKYLNDPARISVGSTSSPIEKIKQEVIRVKDGDKYNQLIKEIYNRQGSILIFVKTRRNAEKMVKRLKYDSHDADAIHGNLRQNKRDRVIKAFRNNHFRILVGTDVASRGLDIPAIKHVINFDLPQVPEDFIHRIGRTARAGAEGSALSFVGGEDRSKWNAIQRLIDPNFKAEPGSEARGKKRGRGGRSFDRRGSRGKNRFDKETDSSSKRRDDRSGSRFKKRDDRDDRSGSRFKKRDDRDDRSGSRFKKRDDRDDVRSSDKNNKKPFKFKKQLESNRKSFKKPGFSR
ncbi:DEAD/DEAH box helicase [Pelagibacteraceae bacterium]|nr:DEAD/DEAH box helicase [Pelagibacteraceae bacterium]